MPRINAVSFHENPSIEEICHKILATGFDSVELSRPPFYNKLTTQGTRAAFAKWLNDLGLSMYGFDAWVEVDPYTAAAATLAGFRDAIDFAADLKLGMIITHDGWKRIIAQRRPSECLEILCPFFRRVSDLADDAGLDVVIEPHPDTLTMDDSFAIDLVDGVDRSNLGLLYDCCHYGVGQPTAYVQAIERLGQRIRHVHFSDGDRATYALHLPLGEGDLDLGSIIKALKAVGFHGTLTNDLYNYPLLEEGARRNVDRIRLIEQELQLVNPPRRASLA
ncbi:MAG: sugar phosphate isomerase/epimerase [Planctomycetia bacterium]|nr:sugar phosphate isomerase/epimerase [Planctomycetia bacterium]